MKRIAALIVLALACAGVRAQEDPDWWNYQSERDGRAYAVRVDMGLRRVFPLSGLPYVVVTGVTYQSKRADGLPEPEEQGRLEALSEAIAAAVGRKTRSIYAGSTARAGQQRSYIYVSDPNGVGEVVAAVYARLCKGCASSTEIRADAAWSAYREALFPDEETRRRYALRAY